MYSNCIESFDFAGCTYFCANNPNLGRHEVNVGDSGRYHWEQNVSLNPNCIVNQKFAAVASQHNDTVIGEVQQQHQCPYFDCTRSKSGMNTKVLSLCTVMFTNKYWQNIAKGCVSYLVFISDGEKFPKFRFWNVFKDSRIIRITECTDVEVGFLQILYTSIVPVLFDKSFNLNVDPKLAYDNYVKDLWYSQAYGCSYATYMN